MLSTGDFRKKFGDPKDNIFYSKVIIVKKKLAKVVPDILVIEYVPDRIKKIIKKEPEEKIKKKLDKTRNRISTIDEWYSFKFTVTFIKKIFNDDVIFESADSELKFNSRLCRRINTSIANFLIIINFQNLTGIIPGENYQQEILKFSLPGCVNERVRHPHSLLIEIIQYYGLILSFLIIYLFSKLYLFPLKKNYMSKLIILIIFTPIGGLGSVTTFFWSILISMIVGIFISKKEI